MRSKIAISNDEKRWEAEEDARTLKRFVEISNDKDRMEKAKKILEEEAKEINTAVKFAYKK